jgi:hypothetical protein
VGKRTWGVKLKKGKSHCPIHLVTSQRMGFYLRKEVCEKRKDLKREVKIEWRPF